MAYLVGTLVVILLMVVLIAVLGRGDRYTNMSEEEFRDEAERASVHSAALLELHNLIQARPAPVIRERKRHKEESSFSGDPPEKPPSETPS